MVKILYAIGVTSGYILQIAPLFNLFDKYLLSNNNGDFSEMERIDPDNARRLYYWSIVLRATLAIVTCLLGFVAGDFSTFLNLQGALVGTLISYVLPCLFWIRVTTYVRAMRAKAEEKEQKDAEQRAIETEYGEEDRQNLLFLDDVDEEHEEEDVDKEPAHINTDKLADETKIEKLQRILCYMMITFGAIGGFFSFLVTSTTILKDLAV